MPDNNKIATALQASFPNISCLKSFTAQEDNKTLLPSLMQLAHSEGLIAHPTQEALEDWIKAEPLTRASPEPPINNFEEFLDNREQWLNFSLSIRAWTDRVNLLLDKYQLQLPKVSNSMLTRLKRENADTTYKQNVLRSLAFWIGCERQELAGQWNYSSLLQLCQNQQTLEVSSEGVRIGFSLSSRGDLIDQQVVDWLKRSLKTYLQEHPIQPVIGRWNKVKTHNITTFYLDIPKAQSLSTPQAYRQSLRYAINLAHQLAIKWALSSFCTSKRFLSIGLVAGDFSSLDNYLLPLLNAKLPGDPEIRISDFTRQCLLSNDIRALCSQQPTEIALFNDEILLAWPITAFWSFIYFDFVPELQQDPVLQTVTVDQIAYPESQSVPATESREADPLATYLQAPQHSMLGLEIAKTLYFRQQFTETIAILRLVLSVEPYNLMARTLRMMIYRNMATLAGTPTGADSCFRLAEQEIRVIEAANQQFSEDFCCEAGGVHLSRALNLANFSRRHHPHLKLLTQNPEKDCLTDLEKAESYFEQGLIVSPSGIRSTYLLSTTRLLRLMFTAQPEHLDSRTRLTLSRELFVEHSENLMTLRGYFLKLQASQMDLENIEKTIFKTIDFHNDSITLKAYQPTLAYTAAVAIWDFYPQRTQASAAKAIHFLDKARHLAEGLKPHNHCIYSFTRIQGEILSIQAFISHLERAKSQLKKQAKALEDNPSATDEIQLLMTCNFDQQEVS